MQTLVALAVYSGYAEHFFTYGNNMFGKPADSDDATTAYPYSDEQPMFAILYVVLAGADFIVVFLSITMLFGIEAKKPSKIYFWPWILFLPLYILYESAINVYYFYLSFQARDKDSFNKHGVLGVLFTGQSTAYGFLLVPLIYWVVKEVVILIFWFFVIFYTREITSKDKAAKTSTVEDPAPQPQPGYQYNTPYPLSAPAQGLGPNRQIFRPPTVDPYGFRRNPGLPAIICRPVNARYGPGYYDRLPAPRPVAAAPRFVPYGARMGPTAYWRN